MAAIQRPLSGNPSENLFVRKPVVKRVDGRGGAWPANGRMTATVRWKARHEETRNPFAAIAYGAIRPADRCRGDRPSLHILARRHGADPPASTRRQPVGVCREPRLSQTSR